MDIYALKLAPFSLAADFARLGELAGFADKLLQRHGTSSAGTLKVRPKYRERH